MFEKSVAAMVREIRESPTCVSRCLVEIKEELSSLNPKVKTNAILKLGYLSMQGYDLSMAYFPIIEMMAQPQFPLKRPAMFVAALAFRTSAAEVALLSANIFHKELASPNYLEVGMALSCLASIATGDIADATLPSVLQLTTFSKAYVRKKVALTIFKLLEKSPKNFHTAFPKLKELLSDPDQSVQTATVNALLELTRRNPKLTVPLIPAFFFLMKETKNNWTKIKLLKIFSILAQFEPRLYRKVGPVLLDLAASNKAKSVEIELVSFVVKRAPKIDFDDEEKLLFVKIFEILNNSLLNAADFNIKCIALNLVGEDLLAHPLASRESLWDKVFACIDSPDSTLRTSALRTVALLVDSPVSATRTIQHLLSLLVNNEQVDLIEAVLTIADNTQLITDVSWYLRVLILLGSTKCAPRDRVTAQFRSYAFRDGESAFKISLAALTGKVPLSWSILSACSWAVGEFADSHFSPHELCTESVATSVLSQASLAESAEHKIECVWGMLRLLVAQRLRSAGELATVQTVQSIEEFATQNSGSISVVEICFLAKSVLVWMEGKDPEIVRSKVFPKFPTESVPVPDDLDKPFIQLPESMKVKPEPGGVRGASFFDLDQDDLFSIESVLVQI